MAIFEDRKKAFEERFRHEEDLRFRVTARGNRLFGEWAAERMGLSGSKADDYAEAVVHAQFEDPGVVRKVLGDFDNMGIAVTESDLRSRLAGFKRRARRQLMAT